MIPLFPPLILTTLHTTTWTRGLMSEGKPSQGLNLGSGLHLSRHVVHSFHRPASQRVRTSVTLTPAVNPEARLDSSTAEAPQASLKANLVLKLQQGVQVGVKEMDSQTLTQASRHKGLTKAKEGHVVERLVAVVSPTPNQLEGSTSPVHLSTPVAQLQSIISLNPYCLLHHQPLARVLKSCPPRL